MKKRGVVSTLLALVLYSPSVLAQESLNLGDTLYKVFGWIFVDLSQHVGDDIYFFWVKFLLFILLLAIYYFGVTKVIKDQNKIARVVALVLSLMSVLLMPSGLLISVMNTYTVVAAVVVMAIPISAAFMICHFVLNKDNPAFNGLKGLIYLLAGFVFGNIAGFQQFLDFKNFASWAGFAEGLCTIAAIYYIVKVIMGVGGEPSPRDSLGALSSLKDSLDQKKKEGEKPEAYPSHLKQYINSITAQLSQLHKEFNDEFKPLWLLILKKNHAHFMDASEEEASKQEIAEKDRIHHKLASRMDNISHTISLLVAHTDFARLDDADQRAVATITKNLADIFVHISDFNFNCNQRYVNHLGP